MILPWCPQVHTELCPGGVQQQTQKQDPGLILVAFGALLQCRFFWPLAQPPQEGRVPVCVPYNFLPTPRGRIQLGGVVRMVKRDISKSTALGGGGQSCLGGRNQIGPNSPHSSEDKPGGK